MGNYSIALATLPHGEVPEEKIEFFRLNPTNLMRMTLTNV